MKRVNVFSSFAFDKASRYEEQEYVRGGRGKHKDELQEDDEKAEPASPHLLPDTGGGVLDGNVAPLSQLSAEIQDRVRAIEQIEDALVGALEKITFAHPVSHVYNPLVYAKHPHRRYLELYGGRQVAVLVVGMNPGPFGMCQTGVPFGDAHLVSEYLHVGGEVEQPVRVHPKRPIHGFKCKRREVSGQRLWGWVQSKWPDPNDFFHHFFVHNYCPLAFMEASSRNRTPDKLSVEERDKVLGACDVALHGIIEIVQPQFVVGVGKFAEGRIRKCGARNVKIGSIMHPSPANPAANKGWEGTIERQLAEMGVDVAPSVPPG